MTAALIVTGGVLIIGGLALAGRGVPAAVMCLTFAGGSLIGASLGRWLFPLGSL